jgi:Poly(ADP-ribose) polymerase catalytic domain.
MLRITSEISNTDELEMINFNDISKTSGTHFDEGEVKLDESIRISGYVARTHCLAIKQKARELGIEIKLDKQAKKIYYNFEQDFTGEFKRYVYELEYLRLLPEGWEGGVYGDFNFKAFPLDIYSAEYNKVLDMFEKSMLFCYNESSLRIKKIQNYCLIRLWLEKSLEYQQEFNQEPEIKLLFYGSTKQNPNEIAQNSIVSFPKTLFEHGQYGNGLYFAEKAVDVAGSAYQIGDSVGTKSILLAAVMLGNYTRFDRVNLVNDDVQYQAIKGNSKSGDVYVLFEENMAYPLYVIEYNETI